MMKLKSEIFLVEKSRPRSCFVHCRTDPLCIDADMRINHKSTEEVSQRSSDDGSLACMGSPLLRTDVVRDKKNTGWGSSVGATSI